MKMMMVTKEKVSVQWNQFLNQRKTGI